MLQRCKSRNLTEKKLENVSFLGSKGDLGPSGQPLGAPWTVSQWITDIYQGYQTLLRSISLSPVMSTEPIGAWLCLSTFKIMDQYGSGIFRTFNVFAAHFAMNAIVSFFFIFNCVIQPWSVMNSS